MGRICTPLSKRLKDSCWKTSGLFSQAALVGPVKAMKTVDMEMISDVSEAALPPTTDQHAHIVPAQKVMHIGFDACKAILHACLDSLK
eukprot:4878376-Pyramimonas_sp.AAC.1